MGWVITAWRHDHLAALLDADARAAADEILHRAEREARYVRRSARREAAQTAAVLEELERVGQEARERVRSQRLARRRARLAALFGPAPDEAEVATPAEGAAPRRPVVVAAAANREGAAPREPAIPPRSADRVDPAPLEPTVQPTSANRLESALREPVVPALADSEQDAPDEPVAPPEPPVGPPPVRPGPPVPPEVAPVPRRQRPHDSAEADAEPTRHPRASMRESVLADLFRSTGTAGERPGPARSA
jgi:hypothetical protein